MNKGIRQGAFLTYLSLVVTNIGGIILTPVIVTSLGQNDYGLYVMLGSLIGYMSMFDFGLNNAMIRYISRYVLEEKTKDISIIISSALFFLFVVAVTLGLVTLLLAQNVDIFLHIEGDQLIKAKYILMALGFNLILVLPGSLFAGIANGYSSFVFPRATLLGKYLLRLAILLPLMNLLGSIYVLIIVDSVLNVMVLILNYWFIKSRYNFTISFKLLSFDRLKTLLVYSMWIFLVAMAGHIQWRGGQIILGSLMKMDSVAIYGVGILLGTYFAAFSSALSSLLVPKATEILLKDSDLSKRNSAYQTVGVLTSTLLFYVLGGFYFYGKVFIIFWVGELYQDAWWIALVIMCVLVFPLSQSFAGSLTEAKNHVKTRALIMISCAFGGVLLGRMLTDVYGIYGMIAGILLSRMIAEVLLNGIVYPKLSLNFSSFILTVYARSLPTYLLGFAVMTSLGYRDICLNVGLNLILNLFIYTLVFILMTFLDMRINKHKKSVYLRLQNL